MRHARTRSPARSSAICTISDRCVAGAGSSWIATDPGHGDMDSPGLKVRAAYSYRNDMAVPRFDDDLSPIVFMDGLCALCTRAARLICRFDRRGVFKISPTRSDLGRAILAHHGLNSENPASWLYLEEGKAYGSMDAMIRVGTRLARLVPKRAAASAPARSSAEPAISMPRTQSLPAIRPRRHVRGGGPRIAAAPFCYEGLHCWRLWRFRRAPHAPLASRWSAGVRGRARSPQGPGVHSAATAEKPLNWTSPASCAPILRAAPDVVGGCGRTISCLRR